jgi:hypothetical protein
MIACLVAIMRRHPKERLTQYVLVLGKGRVQEPADDMARMFWKKAWW